MKPSHILMAALLAFSPSAVHSQIAQPEARKFDEFTAGIGSADYRYGNYDQQQKELKARLLLYSKELRRAGARPYAITYSPRVVPWENHDRSIAEMRAGALWELTPHVDWRNINIVNGGFREIAATELWIVPPGAQPPCPTPTVKAEEVAYCPLVRVGGVPYLPNADRLIKFNARVELNRDKARPSFHWKVSQGEIVSGQGTDTISVKVAPGSKGEVVARVTLEGFSLECPAESTTSLARTAFGFRHVLFTEFGNIGEESELAQLDNLAVTLQDHPELQVHLVFYGGRVSAPGEATARATRARDYLVKTRAMEADRVLILDGGYRSQLSGEYWLSLRGAEPPVARPTIDKSFVQPGRRPRR